MQQTITLAAIGCGYWGPNLIRNFHQNPGFRVKTICDRDGDRLLHLQQLYPEVAVSHHADAVLEDPEVDAVAIATPASTHYELARRSLEAGKHTFVEKPLALCADHCRHLTELAGDRGLTLMTGHTFVFSSPVRKIKEIIEAGTIGDVMYINSQRLNLGLFQKDINVTWDLAPHDISIILYLLGDKPLRVNCQGKCHVNPGVEDVTNMSLSFRNGGFATIQSSWLDPNKIRRMTIVGSRAMILYDDTEPLEKIRVYDKRVEVPPHYDTYAEFQFSYHYGDVHAPYIQQTEPLKVECQHFLDCIRTGCRPLSGGEEGMDVVRILEAASESLRHGGGPIELLEDEPVSVPEPAELAPA